VKRKTKLSIVVVMTALLIVTLAPGLASAHERRTVGKYSFVVGFLNEPAYAGEMNSLDLTICDGSECKRDDKSIITNPINDAQKTLKVEASFGGNAPITLDVEPRYNQPGKYSGYFKPAKVGAYTFHIFGTIGNDKIDEKFTSGPKTFGEAEELAIYPATDSSATNIAALQSQVKEAKDSAGSATIFGIIGIVVGFLGLAGAGLAITRKPKVVTAETARETADSRFG
jgi:hypothetical protein